MRIIIDWVDWSWKTTLINTIAEKTWWPVIKFSAPKTNNPFKEWKEYYEPKNEKYIWDNVILDRCWISEVMYWPIKWRPKLTQEQIDYFKNKTKNDLYIISQASKDFIKNAFDTRWEDYINLEEAIEINRKYLEFTNRNKLWKRFYYYYPEFVKKDNIEHYFNSYIKEHYEKSKNN